MIDIKKNNIVLFLFALTFVGFSACEEEDRTFQGDPIFAFETPTVNLTINQVEPRHEIPVMLVGPHQENAKSASFEVLDYHVNVSGDTIRTTAESDVHYQPFASNRITFSPNSSTAHIPIEFNFENLERGEVYTMVFLLTGGDFGTSEKANELIIMRFQPHRYLIPELLEGTFTAQEISNQPNFTREYEVTLELDSVHPNGRVFEYLVDGFWLIQTADSSAGAWDRQKIRIIVDDTSPTSSVTTAPDLQNFFRTSDGTFINWEKRTDRSFSTWDNTFNFPSFNLKRADNGNEFPPGQAGPRGQNVRITLTGIDIN